MRELFLEILCEESYSPLGNSKVTGRIPKTMEGWQKLSRDLSLQWSLTSPEVSPGCWVTSGTFHGHAQVWPNCCALLVWPTEASLRTLIDGLLCAVLILSATRKRGGQFPGAIDLYLGVATYFLMLLQSGTSPQTVLHSVVGINLVSCSLFW